MPPSPQAGSREDDPAGRLHSMRVQSHYADRCFFLCAFVSLCELIFVVNRLPPAVRWHL